MAKKKKRRYSSGAGSDVKNEMRRFKRGTAKTGRGGKGGKVKSRKQAIAIGLSKARKKARKFRRKRHEPLGQNHRGSMASPKVLFGRQSRRKCTGRHEKTVPTLFFHRPKFLQLAPLRPSGCNKVDQAPLQ